LKGRERKINKDRLKMINTNIMNLGTPGKFLSIIILIFLVYSLIMIKSIAGIVFTILEISVDIKILALLYLCIGSAFSILILKN
jgi:hypothetical protein